MYSHIVLEYNAHNHLRNTSFVVYFVITDWNYSS
jgi:hypothetical protein